MPHSRQHRASPISLTASPSRPLIEDNVPVGPGGGIHSPTQLRTRLKPLETLVDGAWGWDAGILKVLHDRNRINLRVPFGKSQQEPQVVGNPQAIPSDSVDNSPHPEVIRPSLEDSLEMVVHDNRKSA